MPGGYDINKRFYNVTRTTVFSNDTNTQLLVWKFADGTLRFSKNEANPSTNASDLQLNFTLTQAQLLLGGVGHLNSAMPAGSELQTLFQNYRINYVDVTFIYHNTGVWALDIGNDRKTSSPLFLYATDNDDSLGTNALALMQYENHKKWFPSDGPGAVRTIRVYPKARSVIWSGQTITGFQQTGYQQNNDLWLNVENADIPHYGLKMAMMSTTPADDGAEARIMGSVTIACKYNMTFRDLK